MEKRLSTYTFWEEYQRHIKPTIAEIDIFLKTAEYPLDAANVAYVLDLDEDEVLSIVAATGCEAIDKAVFLHIMSSGSSRICRMYAKEVEVGSPPTYTASQLSYIYNLDLEDVKNACQKLQIKEATAFTMPLIFANIPY
ncbi:MAG: hypothetical protein LBE55_04560 [Clostridiales bacterium]|jgi:hypothetical protein|nr:hypothetical protein [Clostridiales bacterium]